MKAGQWRMVLGLSKATNLRSQWPENNLIEQSIKYSNKTVTQIF